MAQATTRPAFDTSASYPVESFDVEYRRDGDRPWLARIHQPQGTGPFPAIIEVHGGAWRDNDRMQNEPQNREQAAGGIVVVSLDFRTSNDAPYPASQLDINYATRWLKLHATEFNASTELIGGIGYSSGGHQVMLSAMRPAQYATLALESGEGLDARLAYVVMCWPVIDPNSRQELARKLNNQRLIDNGLAFFGDEESMKDANPQVILERGEDVDLPPALLLQGAADAQLAPGMAEAFVRAYSDRGGMIEYARYPGAPHGFMRDPGADVLDPAGRQLFESNLAQSTALIRSFISRQLALAEG